MTWLCACGPATQAALDREEAPLNTSELRDVGATLTLQPGIIQRDAERETTLLLAATVGELTIAADAVVPGNGAVKLSFENGHRQITPQVRLVEQRALPSEFGGGCDKVTRTFDCDALRRSGATLPQLCSTLQGQTSLAIRPTDLEIAGSWQNLPVGNQSWGFEEIVSYDNARNIAVVRVADGSFDTITWIEPAGFEELTSCRIARNLKSQAEAEAVSTLDVDTSNPAAGGCNGGPWETAASEQSARLHVRKNDADDTKFELSVQLRPCQTMYIDLTPEEERQSDPVSFVVIGALREPSQFTTIVDAAEPLDAETGRRPGTHDFYVLLGDALANTGAEELGILKSVIEAANVPTIVILGDEEAAELGTFVDLFGPFDFRWTLKGTQFLNLYSADQQLREQGMLWLETSVLAMQDEDRAARELAGMELGGGKTRRWPALAFTHTPPYDPNPLREKGFTDRVQASRVMSLLTSYGVDTLFAGHVREPAAFADARPRLRVTTAVGPSNVQTPSVEFLTVTLTKDAREGARAVGDRFMTVDATGL